VAQKWKPRGKRERKKRSTPPEQKRKLVKVRSDETGARAKGPRRLREKSTEKKVRPSRREVSEKGVRRNRKREKKGNWKRPKE